MRHKIMIIEDDPIIQTQLKNLLTANGYEVSAVTDFENTIQQVQTCKPHLVLLDIKLPGCSGFELCSQIHACSDVPIVFVTSSNTDMDELNSIMLGGDAFITKPYHTAILLAKISSLLRRRDAVQTLVLQQLGIWFGLPIISAILVSAVIITYFIQTISAEIAAYIGFSALYLLSSVTAGILVMLLVCYFLSTWILFQRAVGSRPPKNMF